MSRVHFSGNKSGTAEEFVRLCLLRTVRDKGVFVCGKAVARMSAAPIQSKIEKIKKRKLNTGCKKSKEERTDLMTVSEKPILTFTIDFETAKRYRKANKMPHQFRRAAWTDLTVEVYL